MICKPQTQQAPSRNWPLNKSGNEFYLFSLNTRNSRSSVHTHSFRTIKFKFIHSSHTAFPRPMHHPSNPQLVFNDQQPEVSSGETTVQIGIGKLAGWLADCSDKTSVAHIWTAKTSLLLSWGWKSAPTIREINTARELLNLTFKKLMTLANIQMWYLIFVEKAVRRNNIQT